jgi:phenylpropionate dioxygenase-like ring-hydroxylating dioxygenase large terminal subunit
MRDFHIDPDIQKAWTLPSRFYTDERYFELSKEKIFTRTWQFLCREDEIRSLKPITMLPGFLDEPILLSRVGDRLHCLSNVCTHRGKLLIDEECQVGLIRCSYHGRRFSLDGKFLSMPEFDGVSDFPSESDDLGRYEITVREGFLFVSCDPISDFERFLGMSKNTFSQIDTKKPEFVGEREYEVRAHWALYCENYLEGFHIPYVHKGLNEIVDYATYSIELFRYSSLQTGFDDDGEIAGRYLFIFPNMMFNLYPWGLSINVVEPISVDRTRIKYLTYVTDEAKRSTGAGADLHRVELEDEAVVESVQKGIRSRFYDHGRYSPAREQGTHHFHRLITEFMSDAK